jgi:hypothetical protein
MLRQNRRRAIIEKIAPNIDKIHAVTTILMGKAAIPSVQAKPNKTTSTGCALGEI